MTPNTDEVQDVARDIRDCRRTFQRLTNEHMAMSQFDKALFELREF
jgi:hypothetical protein